MTSSVWNKAYWLLLLSAGAVFYILNLQTPFSHDDYAYCFFYDSNSRIIRPTDIRVTGFWQMFQSMWNHYLYVNGRFSSHLLLQFFCSFLGKRVFNVLNTGVFLGFLHTLSTAGGQKKSVLMLSFVLLITSFLIPFPGQTMLWMVGSLNYLWPTTFSLIYLTWLKHRGSQPLSVLHSVVLFFACLALGWCNESITIPIALGLFCYFVFNKDKFRNGAVCSFLGYALGAMLIILSPGSWTRAQGEFGNSVDLSFVQLLFQHSYHVLWGYVHNVLPLLALIFVFHSILKQRQNPFVNSLFFWILSAFILFLLLLGYDEDRVYFGVSAISLLLLTQAIYPLVTAIEKPLVYSLVTVSLCVIPAIMAIRSTKEYAAFDNALCDDVRHAPAQCVIEARSFTKRNRFVYAPAWSADRLDFHNRVRSFYFGKDFIQVLPGPIFHAVTNDFDETPKTTKLLIHGQPVLDYHGYWLLHVKEPPKSRVSAIYTYPSDNTTLHLYQRILRYLLNSLDSGEKALPCYCVEINDSPYLVLKPLHNCTSITLSKF